MPLFAYLISILFAQTVFGEEPHNDIFYDWYPKSITDIKQSCAKDLDDCLCQGEYREPPRIDLGLSSEAADAIFAAADTYAINEEGVAELRGEVVLQQRDMQVESDEVTLDRQNNLATVKGKVKFRQTDFLLIGEKAVVDLDSQDAEFTAAEYIAHTRGLRGKAHTIQVFGQGGLSIKEGSYTGCDPNDNSWHVQGKSITLDEVSGWGVAKHMTLNVKEVPIFYSPYFKFPIDDRRQSGFLYPNINISDPDIAVPYYFNIAPNYDATLTPRRIGRRGEMLEGQFRYLTPSTGLGEFNAAYLPNDGDHNYQDRKLFHWTQKSQWNAHWRGDLNINYASDNDYFADLGSDLAINSASHLDRKAEVRYRDDEWEFRAKIHAFQTIDQSVDDNERPYRELPEIQLNNDFLLAGTDISAHQLRWINKAEYTYFEQKRIQTYPYAHRLNIDSTLAWQMRWPWGHLTPAIQLRTSQYQLSIADVVTTDNLTPPRHNHESTRGFHTPMASLDTGLLFERSFSWTNQQWLQTLEPRLFYVNVPYEDQSDIPLFDTTLNTFSYNQLFRKNRFSGGDRLGDTEQISLGLTTRFINEHNGREILRASAGQIFYLKDRRVQLAHDTRGSKTTDIDNLDRSAIAMELSTQINDTIRVFTDAVWDEEINTLMNASLIAGYHLSPRQLWNLGYRYRIADKTTDRIAQAEFSFFQKLTPQWNLIGRWHFDLENNATLEQLSGLTYESCCWSSSVVYRRKITDAMGDLDQQENDYAILFQIELKGLAGLGGSLDRILQRGIPGYNETQQW
jgi:LPS-assembly protein